MVAVLVLWDFWWCCVVLCCALFRTECLVLGLVGGVTPP
jgi:hypothetical protein